MDIEITLQKLAFFRCVHENFMNGCGNYILETVSISINSHPTVSFISIFHDFSLISFFHDFF